MFRAEDVRAIYQSQRNVQKVETQRTKRKNEQKDLHIQEDIRNYFKEGGIPLLDRMPPTKDYEREFDLQKYMYGTSGVSFTFKQCFRDSMTELQLRQHVYHTLKVIALNRDMPLEITLIPDCDEVGNFHYHGLITLPIKYRPSFKRLVTKYIGYMKFDYLTDADGWKKYCFKGEYNKEEIQHLGIYLNIV